MTVIRRSALVPYSADKMFKLVDNIAAYPEFLPWCRTTEVHSREGDTVKASIELAKAGIHKRFTTLNTNRNNNIIEMQLVEGPFQHLQGFWRFDTLDEDACKVSLDIEFEFSSKIISATLGPVFSQICNSLVNAFVNRAQEIYGG